MTPHSTPELKRLAQAARALFRVCVELRTAAFLDRPTREIDRYVQRQLRCLGFQTAMAGYRGYPAHCSVSRNSVAVHGVPNGKPLRRGDVFSLDIAAFGSGWAADSAWTYVTAGASNRRRELVHAAWRAFRTLLVGMADARTLADIARLSREAADEQGLAVIPEFVGHAIGRRLHERPVVPFVPGVVAADATELRDGVALNIEPVFTTGDTRVEPTEDGWAYRTVDGAATAHFEVTVLRTAAGIAVAQFDSIAPDRLPLDLPFGDETSDR